MRRIDSTYRTYTLRLLRLVDYVARHGGVSARELVEEIGFSRATLYRAIRDLRLALGARVAYDRRNREYGVQSWGVIDPAAARRQLRSARPKKT